MELYYYKEIREEIQSVYLTWVFIETDECTREQLRSGDYGWCKLNNKPNVPWNLSKEEAMKYEAQWYLQANREDLHFAAMESQEAAREYQVRLTEILINNRHNKEIINAINNKDFDKARNLLPYHSV